jgi:hypothetical protein
MGMIRELILDIVHLHNEYTSTGMYMGLYFCMLLLLGLFSENKRHRYEVVCPALITLFLVYFLLPFIKCFTGVGLDDLTRARTFWALMPPAVIALGFTLIAARAGEKRKQAAALAAIVLILSFSGEFKINNNVFQKAENLYKLPQPLLDVSDRVLSEEGDEKGVVRLIVPYETAHVFRQYSPDIHLLYGEDATILRVFPAKEEYIEACDQMQTEAPDLNYLKTIAKDNEVDYILFDSVYHCFGGNSLNFAGYTEQPDFAGDRSSTDEQKAVTKDVKTIDNGADVYWDLSGFVMDYAGTYGQYILYRFV